MGIMTAPKRRGQYLPLHLVAWGKGMQIKPIKFAVGNGYQFPARRSKWIEQHMPQHHRLHMSQHTLSRTISTSRPLNMLPLQNANLLTFSFPTSIHPQPPQTSSKTPQPRQPCRRELTSLRRAPAGQHSLTSLERTQITLFDNIPAGLAVGDGTEAPTLLERRVFITHRPRRHPRSSESTPSLSLSLRPSFPLSLRLHRQRKNPT